MLRSARTHSASRCKLSRFVRTLVTRIAVAHPTGPASTVVVFVPQVDTSDGPRGDPTVLDWLEQPIDDGRVRLESDVAQACSGGGGVHVHYLTDGTRIIAVGTGEKKGEASLDALRGGVGAAMAAARQLRATSVAIVPPLRETPADIAAVTTASILAGQQFSRHSTPSSAARQQRRAESFAVETVDIVAPTAGAEHQRAWRRAAALANGTVYARELACRDGDELTPHHLEVEAIALGVEHGLKMTVLDETDLAALGCNMLIAVGQAATHKSRLVALEYDSGDHDDGAATPTVAVVGKGVTFDTGGLNLKPTGAIEDMHMDMGGAAATLGAALAVATLQPPRTRAVFVVALAENAVAAEAYKPYSILTSMKGSTVRVGNTDAEGRLCLADAMTWVQREHRPAVLLDVATLTGACVVGLGEYAAGLFTNDGDREELARSVEAAGASVGERLHRLPLYPEHKAELKSDIADICSTGAGRYGGASTAAAFLEHFVEDDVAWVHLDIAGPAMTSEARGMWPKGGTGFGAAALAAYVCGDKV